MYVLNSVCAVHIMYILSIRTTYTYNNILFYSYLDRNNKKIDDCFALALTGLS